jgi:hypothetical protein
MNGKNSILRVGEFEELAGIVLLVAPLIKFRAIIKIKYNLLACVKAIYCVIFSRM